MFVRKLRRQIEFTACPLPIRHTFANPIATRYLNTRISYFSLSHCAHPISLNKQLRRNVRTLTLVTQFGACVSQRHGRACAGGDGWFIVGKGAKKIFIALDLGLPPRPLTFGIGQKCFVAVCFIFFPTLLVSVFNLLSSGCGGVYGNNFFLGSEQKENYPALYDNILNWLSTTKMNVFLNRNFRSSLCPNSET